MYIALDLSDDDRARASEKIIVIDRNDVNPAQMKEIWHGSIEQAHQLHSALGSALFKEGVAITQPKKKAPKAKKS